MSATDVQTTSVSIVVPTFNRRERLARLLDSLDQHYQEGARFEVVVVVDGATDGTHAMLHDLRTLYPLRVIAQRNQGPGAARNRAIERASGDLLLFLDDDVVPVKGMIARHLAIHQEDARAVVIGPMVDPPNGTLAPWLRWEAVTLRKQYRAMETGMWAPTARQFYTANASLRREHALAVGGFDEGFTRAEDVEFAYRLSRRGMHFYFEPGAAVLHEPDRSFAGWLRVGYEYGRHDVWMAQHAGHPYVLELAAKERQYRRLSNRAVSRFCVGHRWRSRATLAVLAAIVRYSGPGVPFRLQRMLCSALFNLQYWQGIADASGTGSGVWSYLDRYVQDRLDGPSAAKTPMAGA